MVRTKNVASSRTPAQHDYDTSRFAGPRQATRYENLEGRTVVQEKKVELSDLESDAIVAQIMGRGWTYLCDLEPSYKALTLEFYANAWELNVTHSRRKYRSRVRGHNVKYDADAIQELLQTSYRRSDGCRYKEYFSELRLETDLQQGLIDGPDCPYQHMLDVIAQPGITWKPRLGDPNVPHKIKVGQLNAVASFWYRFSIFNLLPVTNASYVNVPRAALLCSIMCGEQVNICQIIADDIYDTVYLSPGNASLGHSSLIQALCQRNRIPLPTAGVRLSHRQPLRTAAYHMADTDDEGPAAPGSANAHHAQVGATGPSDDFGTRFDRLEASVEALHASQARMEAFNTQMWQGMYAYHGIPFPPVGSAPPHAAPPADDHMEDD